MAFVKNSLLIILSLFASVFDLNASLPNRRRCVGVFTNQDSILPGLVWGNWGSRPYEYAWVASVAAIKGKRVIDLGVGLPSQYNWYTYVVTTLKPSFYAGIDGDARIKNELISEGNFEIKHMNMAALEYPDKNFDTALCISTFEHIPYEIFMDTIQEAHRVLKDDGLLIITLDEGWDKDQPITAHNRWNDLEQSLLANGLFVKNKRSFGLPEFLDLIKDFFVLAQEDAVVDYNGGVILSSTDNYRYYDRKDKDQAILHSNILYNSCVSYAVLRKKI